MILAAAALLSQAVWAAIPQQVSYEGRVTVAGQPFNGSGLFRFTLANRDTSITLWCNDGSRVGQSANTTPTAAVALAVTTGIVSVRLGDTALANMTALPATVFDGDRMVVRVWFDDGSHGNRLLSPDQPITSVGYAFHAAKADTATVALSVVGGGGAGIPWTDVTSTSIHAAANRGYVANNASTVTITLPTSATLSVGDIIAVSGAGTGGWKIAQNTGQKIHVRGYGVLDYSKPWAAGESNRDWRSVASSSDGTKLVACVYGGQLYTSSDSGVTWTARESSRNWQGVASSSDGSKLVASDYGGQLYTSSDSGVSWTARAFSQDWFSVASSSDGTKLVACVYGGQIYTSSDSGVSWTARESFRSWWSVASSSDGTKLVACVNGGQIYTSSDSGVNWTARESNRNWPSVASSSDGTKLVACVAGGQIYMSADSGATWTPRESNRDWYCVTSSADGTKLAACVYLGQIYTCDAWQPIPETIEGTAGSLTGAQYDAIELQYIGANEFLAICHNAGNPTMGITASYARTAGMAVSANSANTASMATTATVALTALNANHATTADTATTATYALNSSGWSLTGNSGTTSGTSFLGTTDNRPLDLRVNNTRALRLEPNAAGPSIIAGYADNSITSGVVAGTIAGGGAGVWPWYPNLVSDSYGTVGGGSGNRAGNSNGDVSDARHATVAGGQGNVAISERATVGGGLGNVASGYTATVAGGEFNTAFGSYSSVPGGTSNTAQGMWSFAAGRRAKANHHGAFVWADSTDADIASSGNDQFIVRASGGVGINTNAPGAFVLRVGGTVGVDGALNMAADGTAGEITNLAEPTTSQSAATKNYVDNAVTDVVATTATVALSALDSFKWVRVTATSQQAQANRGYMADNASLVTITLPTSATLAVGDTIRVSGAGLGTWKIAQQAGQKIRVRNLQTADYSGPWTARESNRNWYRVASSADGTKLLTAVMGGQIYTSWDSGATWTPRESDRNWFGVASSADGTKLVATAAGGQIYTSSDSGVTWTARDSTSQSWRSVASAADGSKLVAVVENGQIYTSSDSGVTWTARETSRYWTDVASSADGTKLVACVNGGQIYTSSDSGTSWTARESNRSWYGVASSADGTKLVACVSLGQIYTSSDSGVTWTARESNRAWYGVASSADGTRLVASTEGYQIYTSSDSGLTWTARESSRDWHGVASSADGTKLVVCIRLGQIYTYDAVSRRETTTGTGGYLMGGQEDAVELQYIGANTFVPISWAGTLTAQ